MSIFKKAAKVVKRGAKRGARLGAKVAKKTPPYGTGRVIGSLVRGKAPRTSDVMTMVGMPPMKRKGGDVPKLKKMLSQRAKMMPVEKRRLRQRTAIGTAWSMPPKTAASSVSRPPVRKKRSPKREVSMPPGQPGRGEPSYRPTPRFRPGRKSA